MEYTLIAPEHDAPLAKIIRSSLKAHHLDIPGTVYYDEGLDHLSDFYLQPDRAYYVLLENGIVIGGIGLASFDGFDDCCELQKLYLADTARGHGQGYEMIRFIEERALEKGFRRIYLETHTNLQAAIHIYEHSGYTAIDPPACVVHSAMNRFYLKELN